MGRRDHRISAAPSAAIRPLGFTCESSSEAVGLANHQRPRPVEGGTVTAAVLQTLLVVAALDYELRHLLSWPLLLLALAILSVTCYCYRGFAASYCGESEPSLPPSTNHP